MLKEVLQDDKLKKRTPKQWEEDSFNKKDLQIQRGRIEDYINKRNDIAHQDDTVKSLFNIKTLFIDIENLLHQFGYIKNISDPNKFVWFFEHNPEVFKVNSEYKIVGSYGVELRIIGSPVCPVYYYNFENYYSDKECTKLIDPFQSELIIDWSTIENNSRN